MNRRLIFIITLIIILAFTLYEELSLRHYLFKQHDYILAGSLPNFLAVLILSLVYQSLRLFTDNRSIIRFILSILAGLSLYEVIQLFMPNMVFDFFDILASILGGLFAWLLIYCINRLTPA